MTDKQDFSDTMSVICAFFGSDVFNNSEQEGPHERRYLSDVIEELIAARVQAAIKQEREACAKACEALRDNHCASTKLSSDKRDWCEHDDQCCEFVVGWNDAAAAIRARSEDREGS